MNMFHPITGTKSEWSEARSRLDAYLLALHLVAAAQRERILQGVLQQAATKHAQNPLESPTVLVMNEIRDRLEQWFEKMLKSRERASVTGLISLAAMEESNRWPAVFMAEQVPAAFQRDLLACEVRAAPHLRVSSMVPQPFDPVGDISSLPSALGELTKNLTPSFVAKTVVFILSGISVWWSNRLR